MQMKKVIIQKNSLAEKLKAGLDMSFKNLVKAKQQSNGVLVFSENGKIIKVKARDIKI